MKVLFIYSETLKRNIYPVNKEKPLYANDEMPFGIAYLSSSLLAAGHITDIFIATKKSKFQEVCRQIDVFEPDIICFSAVFREYETMRAIARAVKDAYPEKLLVAGGPHITMNPEECITQSFDIICLSEGEMAITELANRLEKGEKYDDIQNLWVKMSGRVIKNPTRCFNRELDLLPFPDRKLFDKYIVNRNTPVPILIGRGCPFECTYCCNHSLKKISAGKYVRFRSPENIIDEIRQVVLQFPENDTVYFEVESINIDLRYVDLLCTALQDFNKTLGKNLFYGVNMRIIPGQDIASLFSMFRKGGITYVNIGLESGSEYIRHKVMNRNYSNTDVLNTVREAKKKRLLVMLYVMIGLPEETPEHYGETVQLVKTCKPSFAQLNIFCPYPGTILYEKCEEQALLSDSHADLGRNVATLKMQQFSKMQIYRRYYSFYAQIYAKNRRQYFVLQLMSFLVQVLGITSLYPLSERIMDRIRKGQ